MISGILVKYLTQWDHWIPALTVIISLALDKRLEWTHSPIDVSSHLTYGVRAIMVENAKWKLSELLLPAEIVNQNRY